MDNDSDLSGRVAWVTGGAGGIGSGIVSDLLGAKAAVAVLDIAKPAAADAVGDAQVIECDLADPASVSAAADEADATVGPADILVNVAAAVVKKPLVEMTEEEWQLQLDINLTGTYRITRRVLPGMMERRWGRIVTISSSVAMRVWEGGAAYAATKAGLIAFTRTVALEAGSYGITANCIGPGLVDTPMARSVATTEEEVAALRATVGVNPLNAALTPGDIGAAVLFFCLPSGRHVTGQTLLVNCGSVMW